jgi:hypothetical protein
MRGAVKARSLGYLCHRLGRNRICWMCPQDYGSEGRRFEPRCTYRQGTCVLAADVCNGSLAHERRIMLQPCCNRRSTEPNKTGFASELGG